MKRDTLNKFAAGIKTTLIGCCVRVAELHYRSNPGTDFQLGYNQAVSDIAAKIRELDATKESA